MPNVKVLIIEDEPAIAGELENRLKSLGYEITGIVPSVESALEHMETRPVNVILADIHKSTRDKTEVTADAYSRFNIPVINLTTSTDRAIVPSSTSFTESPGYWLKPFHEWELRAAIETAFRRNIEHRLHESEARNKALLDANPDLMFVLDRDGKYLDLHAPDPRLLYAPAEQLLGKSIREILPADLANRLVKAIQNVLDKGGEQVIEYPLVVNKEQRFFEARIVKYMEQTVLSLVRDITERKQAELSLRESEEKYRALVENAVDSIYLVDRNHKVLSVNQFGAELFGVQPNEIIGKSIFNLFPKNLAMEYSIGLDRVFKVGVPEKKEAKLKIDEKEFWVSVILSPIKDDDKKNVIAVIGVSRDITAHKQTEELLRESEAQYRTLVNEINDGFYISDLNGILTFANQALAQIHGFDDPKDLIGRRFLDFVSPAQFHVLLEKYREAMTRGSSSDVITTEIVCPDGNRKFVEIKPQTILEDGIPTGSRGVVRDITERKLAEESLFHSEQKFRGLMEASPDGIIVVDEVGRIMLVNAQIENLFGYRRNELLNQTIEILLPKRHRTAHLLHRAEYYSSPYTRPMGTTLDLMALRKDGSEFPVEVSLSPLVMNKEILVTAVVRDVTERRRTEEALAEKEHLYRTLFDLSPSGIVLQNTDGSILDVNDAFAKSLGYATDELIGRNVHMLAAPERLLEVDEDISALRSGKRLDHVVEDIRKDGTRRLMELRESLVPLPNGRQGILVAANDITERRRAEIKLRESEKKYRTLLENIPQRVFYKDKDSVYITVNPSYARDFDITPDEFVGKTDYDLYPPELANKYRADDHSVMQAGQMVELDESYLEKNEEKIVHTVKVPVTDESGGVTGVLGVFWDITERKQTEEALKYLSIHDALTGLYNRGYFDDALERLEHGRRFPISIVVADIDNLKETNDHRGHIAGDALIKKVAQTLASTFRAEDIVARTGGDEFCVLLPNTNVQAAKDTLQRVRRALKEHNTAQTALLISLSLGISTAQTPSSLLATLKKADVRMYREKRRHHAAKKKDR